MNRNDCDGLISLRSVVCFIATILAVSGCGAEPRPTVAPKPVDVHKEHFSNGKFKIKDAVVKDGKFLLEKGKEYEYSGSFQLDRIDDEVTEYRQYVDQFRNSLMLEFVVDGDKSGAGSQSEEVGEVTAKALPVRKSSFKSPNVIHFEGKLTPPKYLGESELRLVGTRPDDPTHQNSYILRRTVKVVKPKSATP